ncbi:Tip elongation aberrant protein 1 [Diplonema papillatum]|nr:Tip elongation aberrant protein 1 [Diplonema papillatum]
MAVGHLERHLPVAGYTAVLQDDVLVVYGGKHADGGCVRDAWFIDANTIEAQMMLPRGDVPSARCYHTAHVYGESMHIFHGVTETSTVDGSVVPALHLPTGEWSMSRATGDVPNARCNHASALYKDSVYVVGGYVQPDLVDPHLQSLFALNLETLSWARVEVQPGPAPGPLWGHSLNTCGNNLVAFGGVDVGDGETESDQLWFFSFARRKWVSHPGRFSSLRTNSRSSVSSAGTPQQHLSGRKPVVQVARAVADIAAKNPMQITLEKDDLVVVLRRHEDRMYGYKKADAAVRGYFPESFVEVMREETIEESLSSPTTTTHLSTGKDAAPAGPEPRVTHASCVDTGGKNLVIWGGEVGDPPSKFADAWLFNVKKGFWKQIGTAGAPPPQMKGQQPMVWHGGFALVPLLARHVVYLLDPVLGWSTKPLAISTKNLREPTSPRRQSSPRMQYAAPGSSPTLQSSPSPTPVPVRRAADDPEAVRKQDPTELDTQPTPLFYNPVDIASVQKSVALGQYPGIPRPSTSGVPSKQPSTIVQSTPNADGTSVIQIGPSLADTAGSPQTVVVYVINPGAGSTPGILPHRGGGAGGEDASPFNYYGGHASPATPRNRPAERPREPRRDRFLTRTRTSSPHVHTEAGFKAYSVPCLAAPPSPPRSPTPPTGYDGAYDTPVKPGLPPSSARMPRASSPLQQPASAGGLPRPGALRPTVANLTQPQRTGGGVGGGVFGSASTGDPEMWLSNTSHPASDDGRDARSSRRASHGILHKSRSPSPASRASPSPEHGFSPASPHAGLQSDPLRLPLSVDNHGSRPAATPASRPQDAPSQLFSSHFPSGAPALPVHCPQQSGTPPRSLATPGHPHSPPRASSSTHWNYRDPAALASPSVRADGPAGTSHAQWYGAAGGPHPRFNHLPTISRHEAMGYTRVRPRSEPGVVGS